MDKANKAAGADQPAEPQGIFTPREEPVEVNEVVPVLQPQELRSNITTAGGKGDIRLPGEKKSKKGLVAVVLAILVIIIGLVIFLVAQNITKQDNRTTNNQSQQAFNRYANYVLFENVNSSLAGDFEQGKVYSLYKQFNSDPTDDAFWSEAMSLLTAAVDTYEKSDQVNQVMQGFLQSYQMDFTFVDKYKKLSLPSDAQILLELSKSGLEATQAATADLYSSLLEYAQDSTSMIVENLISQHNIYVALLKSYSDAGCASNSGINAACIERISDTQVITDLLERYSAASYTTSGQLRALVHDLERRCWVVSQQFQKEPVGIDNLTEGTTQENEA